MKVTAIIQARMGSSRLPGKVLFPLGPENKPALVHLVERIRRAKTVDYIVIITTNKREDQIIFEYGRFLKCAVWDGHKEHVLDNILDFCHTNTAVETIVDITADCPLIDPQHIDKMIKIYRKSPDDIIYAANIINRTYPRGFDLQVYDYTILKIVADEITNEKHRNHSGWNIMIRTNVHDMMSFIRNRKDNLGHWRLCIDEYVDYLLLQNIFQHFSHNKFSCNDVIRYLKRNPHLLDINSHVQQKKAGEG